MDLYAVVYTGDDGTNVSLFRSTQAAVRDVLKVIRNDLEETIRLVQAEVDAGVLYAERELALQQQWRRLFAPDLEEGSLAILFGKYQDEIDPGWDYVIVATRLEE